MYAVPCCELAHVVCDEVVAEALDGAVLLDENLGLVLLVLVLLELPPDVVADRRGLVALATDVVDEAQAIAVELDARPRDLAGARHRTSRSIRGGWGGCGGGYAGVVDVAGTSDVVVVVKLLKMAAFAVAIVAAVVVAAVIVVVVVAWL